MPLYLLEKPNIEIKKYEYLSLRAIENSMLGRAFMLKTYRQITYQCINVKFDVGYFRW